MSGYVNTKNIRGGYSWQKSLVWSFCAVRAVLNISIQQERSIRFWNWKRNTITIFFSLFFLVGFPKIVPLLLSIYRWIFHKFSSNLYEKLSHESQILILIRFWFLIIFFQLRYSGVIHFKLWPHSFQGKFQKFQFVEKYQQTNLEWDIKFEYRGSSISTVFGAQKKQLAGKEA